jgi:hypothetical protein
MEETVTPTPAPDELAAAPGHPAAKPDKQRSEPEDLLEKVDSLVEPAPEPENTVLTDEAPVVRWTGPLFALFSLIMVPWTIYISESLPARQVSPNYDVAWGGFDVFLTIALASTAYFALRRSRYLSTAATTTAALLIVDAWFDIMTTPASQVWESILLAVAVELPLAAICTWLSYHTQQLAERRIRLLVTGRLRRGATGRSSSRQARPQDHGEPTDDFQGSEPAGGQAGSR